MMYNTKSSGQQTRALNIAKGVVAQRMLHRELKRRGVAAKLQVKSYREEDLFDFRVKVAGEERRLDFKTFNYYTDYSNDEREPFSPDLVARHRSYSGPDWRMFFPMLVPHTQVRQSKELYCFAVAASIDFRHTLEERTIDVLAAFPYGDVMPFFSSKRLCLDREKESRGFLVDVEYDTRGVLANGTRSTEFTITGEWATQPRQERVTLREGRIVKSVGPFSCISTFQMDRENFGELYGKIRISVTRNDLEGPVWSSTGRNVNQIPGRDLVLQRDDFCNLVLPRNYELYVMGWIAKEDFLKACRKYKGWVWPRDSVSRFANQHWTTVTDDDKETLTAAGFKDSVQEHPPLIKAGFMKTSGKGNGACCYYYPNVYGSGGLKETNLYVLPQDLRIMDELKS
jgi:hypothetical protein